MEELNAVFNHRNWWFGRPFSIHMFARFIDIDKPIVAGNWNPNEFISKDNWEWILNYFEKNAFQDNVAKQHYFVTMGKSWDDDKNNVNVRDLIYAINDILVQRNSDFIHDEKGHYNGLNAECIIATQKEEERTSWVIIAVPSIFESLGLRTDPCIDYLRIQECNGLGGVEIYQEENNEP